jgi:hypothetical protein
MLYGAYIKGKLHLKSTINVAFDIYNVRGELETDKLQFTWTPQYNLNTSDGWGTAGWGTAGYGGDNDASGMLECFDGMHQFIRNFNRIRIRITESSRVPHELHWFSVDARPKTEIRRRKLQLT